MRSSFFAVCHQMAVSCWLFLSWFCLTVMSLSDSITVENVTDVINLHSMQVNSSGYYDVTCNISPYIDLSTSKEYHFFTEQRESNDWPCKTDFITSIFDNDLNVYNNTNNNLPNKLPFDNKVFSVSYETDQCQNPITNDIILCYYDFDSFCGNVWIRVYCNIFFHDSSSWSQQLNISSLMSYVPVPDLSVLCFNDSYLILYQTYDDIPGPSISYTLIDLNGIHIQYNQLIKLQTENNPIQFSENGFSATKSNSNSNSNSFLLSFVILDTSKPSNNMWDIAYIIGYYQNKNTKIKFNDMLYNITGGYDKNNINSINVNNIISLEITDNCCYLIPYTKQTVSTFNESVMISMIDYYGNVILNEKNSIFNIKVNEMNDPELIKTYSNYDIIELKMLQNNNNTNIKYFMAVYSIETMNIPPYTCQPYTEDFDGIIFSIQYNDKSNQYVYNQLNNIKFLKPIRVCNGFDMPICVHGLQNDNQIIVTWSEIINDKTYRQALFAQAWKIDFN